MYIPYVPYIILVPIWYQYLSNNCDLDRRSHPITLTFVLVPHTNLSELSLSTPSGHVSLTLLTLSLTTRLGNTNLHKFPIRSNRFQHQSTYVTHTKRSQRKKAGVRVAWYQLNIRYCATVQRYIRYSLTN